MLRLRSIALLAGLLPIVGAFISYYIAARMDHVASCIPLLEGCASISSAGRASPESLFFRATMIPSAMLMILYWFLVKQWLIKVDGLKNTQQNIILFLGVISAIFLVIYSVAVGFIGEIYSMQRRIGVTIFFSCGLISQLMTTNYIWKLIKAGRLYLPWKLHIWKLTICTLMLLIGLISIPLSIIYPDSGYIDNILEWNYAVIMYVYYILTYFVWSSTDYKAEFHVS